MHPEVFVPERKELYFFSRRTEYAKGIEWYRAQFNSATIQHAIGELTADYLWTTSEPADLLESDRNPNIPALVKKYYPDQKFIIILRDPVERAISAFYHHIRARRIPPTANILQTGKRFGILPMGYYDQHLENWFAEYDSERFLILLFEEDVRSNPISGIKKVFKFLGVNEDFVPSSADKRVHVASNHLYMRINYYLPLLGKVFKAYPSLLMGFEWKIQIDDESRQLLTEHFEPHNARLRRILGRPLPWSAP